MGAIFGRPPIGSINFSEDQNVSFLKDGNRIYGKVTHVECSKHEVSTSDPNTCNLNVSQIWIEDSHKTIHKVSPNETTLQKENMTIEEAKNKYKLDRRVSFTQPSITGIRSGIIAGYGINTTSDRISNTDTVRIHVQTGKNNYYVNIPFTDPSLKLFPVRFSEIGDYADNRKVSLIWQGKVRTGTIVNNSVFHLDKEYIDETKSFINVRFDDDNTTEKIKFTQNGLELSEDPYRVKYMKYKAKYLAQKN